jgi:hypothetical protein
MSFNCFASGESNGGFRHLKEVGKALHTDTNGTVAKVGSVDIENK